ncbi:MAG TPA: Panacea domain-containing protein [Pirellulales bacterium]|nr:Panacea domain-containing protein [Pirellulales bacterium]
MYFHFGVEKTIQAAAVLLRSEPNQRMEYLRLLKLLYIADRESLAEVRRPIIGGRPVAMDHGPLHSEVLDLVKGAHPAEPLWSKHIRKDGYRVELRDDPGVMELSKCEVDKLTEVAERYASLGVWELVELTQEFPEWRECYAKGTSTTIPMTAIIEAVHLSAERDQILQDAEEEHVLSRVFSKA